MEGSLAVRCGERRLSRGFHGGVGRRSGFDRRASSSAANKTLLAIRDSPTILAVLLSCTNVMSALDFLFTVDALEAGYTEGNPLMAFMFAQGHAVAGCFKFVVVAAVCIVIWRMRRYRSVLGVAMLAFAVFSCVLLIHGYGRLLVY